MYFTKEKDTNALDLELKALNEEVEKAIKKRTDWMDTHMEDYAKFKVGDAIYNLKTGVKVGTVSRLYRYYGPNSDGHSRNALHDTSMSIDYEYNTGGMCFDNTSRQIGFDMFGTKENLIKKQERELARLKEK